MQKWVFFSKQGLNLKRGIKPKISHLLGEGQGFKFERKEEEEKNKEEGRRE